jgi:hypothetical protein
MPSHRTDSDSVRRTADKSRRKFLLGVGTAAALAGCLSDSGSGDDIETEEETDGTETPDSTGSTPTPESTEREGERGKGEQSLSRGEARELLPLESLAFRYEPPLGSSLAEFWVAVVGETNATAVRAEAESGGYNEVGPREGTIEAYLGVPVQVDTDGDEVTVFAVNDEGARGPVTSVRVPTDELTAEEARQAVPPEVLSFTYEPPGVGDFGSLSIEVTADTGADTLVAQPQEAPGTFADRVGNLGDDETLAAGTTLEVGVDPDGDEVRIVASVAGATGKVTRWQGPE